MRTGARADDPVHDPLALWRGIDDAIARQAAVRQRKVTPPPPAPPPGQPPRRSPVPARALEPA